MDKQLTDKYELVVGLEVHVQLLTETKIFSADPATYGAAPNTNISVVTLAHPGTLPFTNKKAVEFAIKMGLACQCQISQWHIFDRKNYFYPDLPKGYQLTQDTQPICIGGQVFIDGEDGKPYPIKLNRIHLEEDAGKSIHQEGMPETWVDLNRAGVPLIEIVSEPDIRKPEEAYAYLTEIRKLVRYLDICDGNMEEGSMRCDANVSIRPKGSNTLGKKVEIKNMNSIRNVQRAIYTEFYRQIKLTEAGMPIISETRLYNVSKNTTYPMRTKEELNDYRYFPEPDLPPLEVTQEDLEAIKKGMPKLPRELAKQFQTEYDLSAYDAGILTETKEMAEYFIRLCLKTSAYKAAANWMIGSVKSYLNENNLEIGVFPLAPEKLATIIDLVQQKKVNLLMATQKLFPAMLINNEKEAEQLAKELNILIQEGGNELVAIVEQVLDKYPDKVQAYQKGKKNLIGLFMGEAMKLTEGKVNPKEVNQLLQQKLSKV